MIEFKLDKLTALKYLKNLQSDYLKNQEIWIVLGFSDNKTFFASDYCFSHLALDLENLEFSVISDYNFNTKESISFSKGKINFSYNNITNVFEMCDYPEYSVFFNFKDKEFAFNNYKIDSLRKHISIYQSYIDEYQNDIIKCQIEIDRLLKLKNSK